ncbi:MAG: NAD(P)H-dependent oxidoreductase [Pseudomonadota bacterium]
MQTLLLLHTSLNGADSLSSALARDYAGRWSLARPGSRIVERDLATDPVPHLTAARFAAFGKSAEERSAGEQSLVAESDVLIDELTNADEIVIALPMYNFGIPSTLKAYIDHVARAGVTFRYTAEGPVGLLGAGRAVVFATRGGRYEGSPLDTQSDYVRDVLAFLGVADTRFVYAEGIAMGSEALNDAIASARAELESMLPRAA